MCMNIQTCVVADPSQPEAAPSAPPAASPEQALASSASSVADSFWEKMRPPTQEPGSPAVPASSSIAETIRSGVGSDQLVVRDSHPGVLRLTTDGGAASSSAAAGTQAPQLPLCLPARLDPLACDVSRVMQRLMDEGTKAPNLIWGLTPGMDTTADLSWLLFGFDPRIKQYNVEDLMEYEVGPQTQEQAKLLRGAYESAPEPPGPQTVRDALLRQLFGGHCSQQIGLPAHAGPCVVQAGRCQPLQGARYIATSGLYDVLHTRILQI